MKEKKILAYIKIIGWNNPGREEICYPAATNQKSGLVDSCMNDSRNTGTNLSTCL